MDLEGLMVIVCHHLKRAHSHCPSPFCACSISQKKLHFPHPQFVHVPVCLRGRSAPPCCSSVLLQHRRAHIFKNYLLQHLQVVPAPAYAKKGNFSLEGHLPSFLPNARLGAEGKAPAVPELKAAVCRAGEGGVPRFAAFWACFVFHCPCSQRKSRYHPSGSCRS